MQSFASEVLCMPLRRVDPKFHPMLPYSEQSRHSVKQIIISRRASTLRDPKKVVIRSSPTLQLKPAHTAESATSVNAIGRVTKGANAQTPRLKSVMLVEKGKACDRYRDLRRRSKDTKNDTDLLGYSSDSMMMGGEIILMDLYDRSKKIQMQTRKKGYQLECLALSPRNSAMQPNAFVGVRKKTEEFKRQLNDYMSTLGETWGVSLNWGDQDLDCHEHDILAGRLAQVSHRIGQETLRVLGNR